jgi:hypothetical protein
MATGKWSKEEGKARLEGRGCVDGGGGRRQVTRPSQGLRALNSHAMMSWHCCLILNQENLGAGAGASVRFEVQRCILAYRPGCAQL